MRRLPAIAAACLLPLVICAGLAAARRASAVDGPPSEIIFPEQDIPLRFTHAAHLKRGVECVDCHVAARTSRSAVDWLIPGEPECRSCHAIDRSQPLKEVAAGKGPARCDACHLGFDPAAPADVRRVRIPTPNLKFDHAAHAGTACQMCHGDLLADGVDLAGRDDLPRMRLCLQCHDGKQAASACTTCHMAAPGGRVQADYPEGKLMPSGVLRGDAHDPMFRRTHGPVARNDEAYCRNCHKQSFCTDCHDGVVKPMDFHVGDYVALHTIDARRNNPDCSTCHRLQTFCVGCHSRSGVAGDTLPGRDADAYPVQPRASDFVGAKLDPAGRRYHPAGWVQYSSGSLVEGSRPITHHSYQAQRNLRQCASCHRESFCTQCHSAQIGGLGINPHPNGWRGSRQCRALAARAGRMCLRCHTDPTEAVCD